MPLLDVDNLTRRFGGLSAVSDLSFAIEAGDIRGTIGANGAGKSTTLRAIFGLTGLTSGEIRYDGHRIDGPARAGPRNAPRATPTPASSWRRCCWWRPTGYSVRPRWRDRRTARRPLSGKRGYGGGPVPWPCGVGELCIWPRRRWP